MTHRMTTDQLTALATALGARLAARGFKLATAESCTGGWVAQAVTSIAGSSEWFERGFVTYSNDANRELLGVRAATLEQEGAVSEATAGEMARGALSESRAQVAVSITGVAGPAGGTPEKPVGMVCFGWALADGGADTTTRHFEGDRTEIRRRSVIFAMEGLLERVGSGE